METGTISCWEELQSHTAKDVEAEMVGRIQLSLQLITPEIDLFYRPTLFTGCTMWYHFFNHLELLGVSSIGEQA